MTDPPIAFRPAARRRSAAGHDRTNIDHTAPELSVGPSGRATTRTHRSVTWPPRPGMRMERTTDGLASLRDLPRRGPGVVSPDRDLGACPVADRRGESRLRALTRDQRLPELGLGVRSGRRRLGRHVRRRAACPQAPSGSSPRPEPVTAAAQHFPTGTLSFGNTDHDRPGARRRAVVRQPVLRFATNPCAVAKR